MIEAKDLIEIGKLQRPHALRGEVNALIEVDEEYLERLRFLIINVEGIPTPFEIESIRAKGRQSVLLKFRGVNDAESLRNLVNHSLYALKTFLPDLYEDEGEYADDIIGYTFSDSEGKFRGKVEGVDIQTENTLLQIKGEDGKEYLIPLAEDLVEIMNPEKRLIVLNLPEGLFEL